MNFRDFQQSRTATDDLSEVTESYNLEPDTIGGFIYLDSFYIANMPETNPVTGDLEDDYIVELGSSETSFGDDLAAAERYLWSEFAAAESGAMYACKFSFPDMEDDTSIDGLTYGATWNGWDEVYITQSSMDALKRYFSHPDYDGVLDDVSMDSDGLYFLNGLCTTIDEYPLTQ